MWGRIVLVWVAVKWCGVKWDRVEGRRLVWAWNVQVKRGEDWSIE